MWALHLMQEAPSRLASKLNEGAKKLTLGYASVTELSQKFCADISAHFDAAYKVIDEELSGGHGVLIHCYRGVSRSATLTASYLMRKRGWSLQQTAEHMLQRRSIVDPNEGFVKQLRAFEAHLHGG